MNTLTFDIAGISDTPVKLFAVKLDNNVIVKNTNVGEQETIRIEFDDINPHTLELLSLAPSNSKSGVAVGNFKINHLELIDHHLYPMFYGDYKFDGILYGASKFSLEFTSPVNTWLQKSKIF